MLTLLFRAYCGGSAGQKVGLALLSGWLVAPIVQFVDRYVFNDWPFLISLAVVVSCDTLLGLWLSVRQRRLSSRGFGRLFQKVAAYGLFLVAVHAAATHTVAGQVNTLLGWLDAVAYSSVLARELLSIVEKTARLGLFSPPKALIERLEQLRDMRAPGPTSPEPPHGHA